MKQATLAEPYRERVAIVRPESKNCLKPNRPLHACGVRRKELISTQIEALRNAERTGPISTVVASEVPHRLERRSVKEIQARGDIGIIAF
ncbi:MAG: hypothetical protein Ct9H90mP16_01950 [Candidatus Poseidoniales archaeon]|nr:MAG: hypothetical protein Ct9H90mP16_01950 [Candidatus Poseidoniales archaeon]